METTQAIVDGFPNQPIEVEMLGTNLGLVVDATMIFNTRTPGTVVYPVRKNDIVRLSYCPGETEELPKMTEIVFKASPRFLSRIECGSHDAMTRMIALAAILGAEIIHAGEDRIDLLHPETIDVPAIARAAGIANPDVNFRGQPCHLCKIAFFGYEQMERMIAMAVVLGAELVGWTEDPDEISFLQAEGRDLNAVADAAQITTDPDDLIDLDLTLQYRPGALPGPEWGTGQWENINEKPAESGTPVKDEKQTNNGAGPQELTNLPGAPPNTK